MGLKMARKIGAKGNITIPSALRKEYGLDDKHVTITTNDDGQIILTPFTHTCVFCGSENTRKKPLYGKYICEACAAALDEE